MEIDFRDVVTLDDNKKYIVASKVEYNNSKYACLIDEKDYKNTRIVEIEKDHTLTELDNIRDELLIKKLIPIFYNFTKTEDMKNVKKKDE